MPSVKTYEDNYLKDPLITETMAVRLAHPEQEVTYNGKTWAIGGTAVEKKEGKLKWYKTFFPSIIHGIKMKVSHEYQEKFHEAAVQLLRAYKEYKTEKAISEKLIAVKVFKASQEAYKVITEIQKVITLSKTLPEDIVAKQAEKKQNLDEISEKRNRIRTISEQRENNKIITKDKFELQSTYSEYLRLRLQIAELEKAKERQGFFDGLFGSDEIAPLRKQLDALRAKGRISASATNENLRTKIEELKEDSNLLRRNLDESVVLEGEAMKRILELETTNETLEQDIGKVSAQLSELQKTLKVAEEALAYNIDLISNKEKMLEMIKNGKELPLRRLHKVELQVAEEAPPRLPSSPILLPFVPQKNVEQLAPPKIEEQQAPPPVSLAKTNEITDLLLKETNVGITTLFNNLLTVVNKKENSDIVASVEAKKNKITVQLRHPIKVWMGSEGIDGGLIFLVGGKKGILDLEVIDKDNIKISDGFNVFARNPMGNYPEFLEVSLKGVGHRIDEGFSMIILNLKKLLASFDQEIPLMEIQRGLSDAEVISQDEKNEDVITRHT